MHKNIYITTQTAQSYLKDDIQDIFSIKSFSEHIVDK